MTLLERGKAGLSCEPGRFHVDPWASVERALVTHPSRERVAPGCGSYLCESACVPFLRARLGPDATIEGVPRGETIALEDARVSFHGAGLAGSSLARIEARGETALVGFAFRKDESLEVVRADTIVLGATFGLPIFLWPDRSQIAREIALWRDACGEASRAALLLVDTDSKAVSLLSLLERLSPKEVVLAPALEAFVESVRRAGAALPPTRSFPEKTRKGELRGELVLAPLERARELGKRVGERETGLASGWARIRGTLSRGAFERGFALADEPDWPTLLAAIEASGAREVLVTHGHSSALARFVRERGREASTVETPWHGETIALAGFRESPSEAGK